MWDASRKRDGDPQPGILLLIYLRVAQPGKSARSGSERSQRFESAHADCILTHMKITVGQLRRLIKEVVDIEKDKSGEPDYDFEVVAAREPSSPEEKRSWDIAVYSDIYKEKHGIRPRWMYDRLSMMSNEEFENAMKDLELEEYEDDYTYPDEDVTQADPEVFVDDPELSEPDPWEDQPTREPVRQPSRDRYRRHH